MIITYELKPNVYVNITNRCTNNCVFCIRNGSKKAVAGVDLWLEREPTVEEILADILKQKLDKYEEIVFCGFGEPFIRYSDLFKICREIKRNNIKTVVRVDTNGHGNLIAGRDITGEMKGIIDSVSVSLNAKNALNYQKLCLSKYGTKAYDALLEFAVLAKNYVEEVTLTVVDVIPNKDIEHCRLKAEQMGLDFRVRKFIKS